MPLASRVLATATPEGDAPPSERDLVTSCPTCGRQQTLAEASLKEATDELETVYVCIEGCGPILIVSTPGVVAWEGRGYRLGEWMIRNPRDLLLHMPGAAQPVLMPASPHALD